MTDKICYKLPKDFPKNVEVLACMLISSSINNSFVLVNWKDSQIKRIKKENKDQSKAENYRPISLTNCLAKICKTVVKNIVMEHCESQNTFGETQSAYMKHHRTTDNPSHNTSVKPSSAPKWLVLYAWMSIKRLILYGA